VPFLLLSAGYSALNSSATIDWDVNHSTNVTARIGQELNASTVPDLVFHVAPNISATATEKMRLAGADGTLTVAGGLGVAGKINAGSADFAVKPTVAGQVWAAPFDALAYNGMQINGGMEVSQELGGSARTTAGYICDGWFWQAGGTLAMTAGQLRNTTMFSGFAGFSYTTVTTPQASMGAGDFAQILHRIEGYRASRLAWGTASAQPLTIGFWTAHTRTGTYSGAIHNGAGTRSYAFTYTQNAADTPEYKIVTIPGCTDGAWPTDNTKFAEIAFAQACGSTYTAPSANNWLTGNYIAAPGQINAVAATTDNFRITGVVVLPGLEAPAAARAPLIVRPYDQELLTCQRYLYRRSYGNAQMIAVLQAYNAAAANGVFFDFPVTMRAAPTGTASAAASFVCQGAAGGSLALTTLAFTITPDTVGGQIATSGLVAGNAMALYAAPSGAWLQFDARI